MKKLITITICLLITAWPITARNINWGEIYDNPISILLTALAVIIGAVSFVYSVMRRNRKKMEKEQAEDKKSIKETVDQVLFESLYNAMADDDRRKKVEELANKIDKLGFPIDLYEVQVEIEGDVRVCERRLRTICSNYITNTAQAPIERKKYIWYLFPKKVYTGQTTYAFIRNRDLWITDKKGGFLDKKRNRKVEYEDTLSQTEKIEKIPDFWVMDGNKDKDVRACVIFQLRCPPKEENFKFSNFGFITFCSYKSIPLSTDNNEIREEMEKIAKLFSLDYLEQRIKGYKETNDYMAMMQ